MLRCCQRAPNSEHLLTPAREFSKRSHPGSRICAPFSSWPRASTPRTASSSRHGRRTAQCNPEDSEHPPRLPRSAITFASLAPPRSPASCSSPIRMRPWLRAEEVSRTRRRRTRRRRTRHRRTPPPPRTRRLRTQHLRTRRPPHLTRRHVPRAPPCHEATVPGFRRGARDRAARRRVVRAPAPPRARPRAAPRAAPRAPASTSRRFILGL